MNVQIGDNLLLNYQGQDRHYIVVQRNGRLIAVHNSTTPLGVPLTAIPVEDLDKYDFRHSDKEYEH